MLRDLCTAWNEFLNFFFETGQFEVLVECDGPRFLSSHCPGSFPVKFNANHDHIILPLGDQECKTGT